MRSSLRPIVASLILLAFLAQAGDGLMAIVCPPDMEGMMVTWVQTEGGDSEAHLGMDRPSGEGCCEATQPGDEPSPGDEPCPFGPGSMAMCGGTASPADLGDPSPVTAQIRAQRDGETNRIPHSLLSSQLFRPPRA